jgi:hypothetical protein
MWSPHRLQCKIKGGIYRVKIKILKIPLVGYFYLIVDTPFKMILDSQKSDHSFTRYMYMYQIWLLYIGYLKNNWRFMNPLFKHLLMPMVTSLKSTIAEKENSHNLICWHSWQKMHLIGGKKYNFQIKLYWHYLTQKWNRKNDWCASTYFKN